MVMVSYTQFRLGRRNCLYLGNNRALADGILHMHQSIGDDVYLSDVFELSESNTITARAA